LKGQYQSLSPVRERERDQYQQIHNCLTVIDFPFGTHMGLDTNRDLPTDRGNLTSIYCDMCRIEPVGIKGEELRRLE
jgi:hypothetical protein